MSLSLFRRNHSRNNFLFSYSPSLLSIFKARRFPQRWKHCESSDKVGSERIQDESSFCPLKEGLPDTSIWKTVDSRKFGITRASISPATRTVLKILIVHGYEAYLVGGCVRDLILGKTPKDYDVVTTASLEEIKKTFHRCFIVGSQFPICHVFISGNMIEVSSFETAHVNSTMREVVSFSHMSSLCSQKIFVRWRDSLRRDFTINGLFCDPFVHNIYDYVDGIRDIMASKMRTIIPAQLSFKEDSARILRGLRIAARLGLRFSKETDKAMHDLSPSIAKISKGRLMMELNLMLAYGAAVPSIYLLQKYNLLDIILPIQAAYLDDQAKKGSVGNSTLLVKLFSHYDKLFAADRPSSYILWMSLLAFHMALVNNPQNDIVIWTFASVLYFGTWDRGINYVREKVKGHVNFAPEILEMSTAKLDELHSVQANFDEIIAEKTSQLVFLIRQSIYALNCHKDLLESLNKYQIDLLCPDVEHHLIFISEKAGGSVAKIFCALEHDIKSYVRERESFNIDYTLLKRGEEDENRYALGKIIFDTLHSKLSSQNLQNKNTQISNIMRNQVTHMHRSEGDISHEKRRNFDRHTYRNTNLDKSYESKNQKMNAEKHTSESNMDVNVMVEIEKLFSSTVKKKSAQLSVKKNHNQVAEVSPSVKNIIDNVKDDLSDLKKSVKKKQNASMENSDSKNQRVNVEICSSNAVDDSVNIEENTTSKKKKPVQISVKKNESANMDKSYENVNIEEERLVSLPGHEKAKEKKKSVRLSVKKNKKASMDQDEELYTSNEKASVKKSVKRKGNASMENLETCTSNCKDDNVDVPSSDHKGVTSEKKKSKRLSVKKNKDAEVRISTNKMNDNVDMEKENVLPSSNDQKLTSLKNKIGVSSLFESSRHQNTTSVKRNIRLSSLFE